MSSYRNPDIFFNTLSSLSSSFSRTFRDTGFFFGDIHAFEIPFREVSRKICNKNSPLSAAKYVLKPLIPNITDIVLQQLSLRQHVDWYCIWWPPYTSLLLHLLVLPPSHPQPRIPDFSGHCRTSTASARFQRALPDPNCDRGSQSVGTARHHERQIWVGTATLLSNGGGVIPASQGFRGTFTKFSRIFGSHLKKFINNISVWIQIYLRKPEEGIYKYIQNILKPGFWALKVSFAGVNFRKSFRESFANVVLAFAEPSCFNSPLNLHLEILTAAQISK